MSLSVPGPACRPLGFRGRLYPTDPEDLREDLLREISRSASQPFLPLPGIMLLPHGGLAACAPVVAAGLSRLEGSSQASLETLEVALIGPLHDPEDSVFRVLGDPRRGWETLHGEIPLLPGESFPVWVEPDPGAHDREHCLETLACCLAALGRVSVLWPLLVTPGFDPASLGTLASGVEDWLLGGPNRMLLATTDLDHYHGEFAGPRVHARFLDLLARGDPEALLVELASGRIGPCGGAPSWLFLELARRLGRRIEIPSYGWAGEQVGAAVGYAAALAVGTSE